MTAQTDCECRQYGRIKFLKQETPRKTVLKAKSSEAAVLMIPEDIYTTKLKITSALRKYVADNIVKWYEFVKHTLGHDIENGDLRVVYGCRKSSGFGIATAFNSHDEAPTQLTFSIDRAWTAISGCPYRWTHTGSAEVKAGPSERDNAEIFSTHAVRNQCLFINTIDTKIAMEAWQQIEGFEVSISAASGAVDTSTISESYSASATQGNLNLGRPVVDSASSFRSQEVGSIFCTDVTLWVTLSRSVLSTRPPFYLIPSNKLYV